MRLIIILKIVETSGAYSILMKAMLQCSAKRKSAGHQPAAPAPSPPSGHKLDTVKWPRSRNKTERKELVASAVDVQVLQPAPPSLDA